MESSWATESLQVIRTLMERSAIYRRALAPMMLLVGGLGLAAAVIGRLAGVGSPRGFAVYWLIVSVFALAGAFFVVRRQALTEAEPVWSAPTRRVGQALLPAFFVGLVCGFLTAWATWREPLHVWWLPPIWMVLYRCGPPSSGFLLAPGVKFFGRG